MCSDLRIFPLLLMFAIVSCSQYRRLDNIRSGRIEMSINVPDEKPLEEDDKDVVIDSIRSTLADEPFILKAIKDTETGEMVATDVIVASTVTARFRNVAERFGYVSVSFDVRVPAGMHDSKWQLKLVPKMKIMDETVSMDPIHITGKGYREVQLRGYERYRRFLETIVTDSTCFIREGQLEIFLKRYFPETYAMRNDTTLVSEPEAETLFGATQKEALQHYTMTLRKRKNDRRKARKDEMFGRYVKDPIISEGIRLDTVLNGSSGEFVYRYVHTFRSRPRLRKVIVCIEGDLYEDGRIVASLPVPDDLTFYISSLSSLTDDTPRYKMLVLERVAYDNTKAFLDFGQGSSEVDEALGDNASELHRIRDCISDVAARKEFALDSLVIVASCSPEGSVSMNARLSLQRSEAVRKYLLDYVPAEWKGRIRTSEIPENWEQFGRLAKNDTVLYESERNRIRDMIIHIHDPDDREKMLASLPHYRYMREKMYPKLRSVSFDFHLHRVGMVKDTIHTVEPDSAYMAGVEAIRNLDYKKAVTLLRPYRDYNCALALVSADYNHTALDVLGGLDDSDSRICYLKAVVLSRLGQNAEALKYFEMGAAYDPSLEHRANLDPELSEILKLKSKGYE